MLMEGAAALDAKYSWPHDETNKPVFLYYRPLIGHVFHLINQMPTCNLEYRQKNKSAVLDFGLVITS